MKIQKFTKLRHAILLVMLFVSVLASAVPVNRQATLKQPDGTAFKAWIRGDEFFAFVQTLDGYTILQNEEDWWTYAEVAEDGQLKPGSRIYSTLKGASTDLKKNVMPSQEFLDRIARERANFNKQVSEGLAKVQDQMLKSGKASIYNGTWEVPVLLVEFQDVKHKFTIDDFDHFFHDMDNEEVGSFNEYYNEVSYGTFKIHANIYGWIPDKNNQSYYANSENDSQTRCKDMLRRAIDYAETQYDVDWSKFDNQNKNTVDMVIMVHAGEGAALQGNNKYIWAHMWWGLDKECDGVKFDKYTVQPETQWDKYISSPGLYCHEFGHALGLPDLYDYNFVSEGMGAWGIMSAGSWNSNGYSPAHFCAFSKYKLGWINPIELTDEGTKDIHNYSDPDNKVYKYTTENTQEYYLISNRQKNSYDYYLPGEGIIIEHIDEAKFWNGNNNDPDHKLCEILEADGKWDMYNNVNTGDAGDAFPGSSDVRSISSVTNPSTKMYNGKASGLFIGAISDCDMDMSFKVGYSESDGPIAGFFVENRGGTVGLPVQFKSECMGSNLYYEWTFPGGTPSKSNEANPVVIYPVTGSYSVTLKVSNDNGADTKTIHGCAKIVEYCDASSKEGTGGDYITKVKIGDIEYSSEMEGYANNRSKAFSVKANENCELVVDLANMYAATRLYAWIDWDNNKAFDKNELISFDYQEGEKVVLKKTIKVPADVKDGDSFVMRVRTLWADPIVEADPCGEYYGEIEDYTLFVGEVDKVEFKHCECKALDGTGGDNIDLVTINSKKYASEWSLYTSFANDVADVQKEKEFKVEIHLANYYETDMAFGWVDWNRNDVYEEDEQLVFYAYQNQTAFANVMPPKGADGMYAMRLRNQYGNSTPTSCGTDVYGEVEDYVIKMVENDGVEINFNLCEGSSSDNLGGDYIKDVVVNGRNYFTGYNLYTDNTNFTIDLINPKSINVDVILANVYDDRVFGWIDWNRNNEFEPTEALSFSEIKNLVASASVAVPADAEGVYAMRVRNQYADDKPTACGSEVCGEVEDYALLIKKELVNGDEEISISEMPLTVFPNPVKDKLIIQLPLEASGRVEINVFNMSGMQMATKTTDAVAGLFSEEIDFSDMPKGIYLVQLSVNGQTMTKKVIK